MFYKNTKPLEGNASSSRFRSLWQTIVNLQEIYTFLSGADELSIHQIDGFAQSEYIKSGVKLALEKLDTYFQKLVVPADDGAPSLYCVATAMHPCLRLSWFKSQWRDFPHWQKAAEKSIRDVYNQYLAAEDVADDPNELAELTRKRKVPGAYASDERRLRTMWVDDHLLTGKKAHKRQKRTSQLDEYFDSLYDDNLAASTSPDLYNLMQDPHRWWVDVGQKRFPVIYKMAMDHLSVPATSCDCERCFSCAKRTITCDRNLLTPSVVEAFQLQKNWLRRSAVSSYLTRLADHVVEGCAARYPASGRRGPLRRPQPQPPS
ncbi:transposase-like protein [Paraphaeosphaeria sporulosa]